MFVLSFLYPGFSVLTDLLLVILERLQFLSGLGFLDIRPSISNSYSDREWAFNSQKTK